MYLKCFLNTVTNWLLVYICALSTNIRSVRKSAERPLLSVDDGWWLVGCSNVRCHYIYSQYSWEYFLLEKDSVSPRLYIVLFFISHSRLSNCGNGQKTFTVETIWQRLCFWNVVLRFTWGINSYDWWRFASSVEWIVVLHVCS